MMGTLRLPSICFKWAIYNRGHRQQVSLSSRLRRWEGLIILPRMCLIVRESPLLQGWIITCRLNPSIRIRAIHLEELQLNHQQSTYVDKEVLWVEIAIPASLIPVLFQTLSRDPWLQVAQDIKRSSPQLCSKSWTSTEGSWQMQGVVPYPTTMMEEDREVAQLKSPIIFRIPSNLNFARSSILPRMISVRFSVRLKVRSNRSFASTLNSLKRNQRLLCAWTRFSNALTSSKMKSLRGHKRWSVATTKSEMTRSPLRER